MDSAVLIFMAGMLPVLFLLGMATAYCVMTQRQILEHVRGTGVPLRQMVFYDVDSNRAGRIVREYERRGYRYDELQWNKTTKRGTLKMSGYVSI